MATESSSVRALEFDFQNRVTEYRKQAHLRREKRTGWRPKACFPNMKRGQSRAETLLPAL
ncbi:uncharacterized protein ASCRUDRAFT_73229 [Ascoidea rubescens DSM 1968]|uniref:Uncharacterized protein n=1 Tax=Ascoidea rubescens DSM 1968 TaxID=1344418 RepID=A0A1D2VP27_9ASCO|nr:hypothetical protein ASCRUDRAFT_73229 [Ascoidea rubescens DSM 1968]ODV63349.1 hypothetical protein ASCRUDRAFT_73229 [Ascoidea rubescens DSM 1968]